jgi:hypothetical protein
MSVSNKIVYYYQTFVGLDNLLISNCKTVTHINVSSIHFGENENNIKYIHLNNNDPNNKCFDKVWNQCLEASKYCKIYLMIGGAGSAYETLFSDFETYYKLLHDLLKSKSFISGVDLDIEESVNIQDIKMLMNRLNKDFENLEISMAPLNSSLSQDIPGMGGFIYKDLYNSEEGKLINHFNVQSYGDYNENIFDSIVNNGYPPEKIVLGMISSQNINEIINVVELLFKKYGSKFGGVFNWEYFDSPPSSPKNPEVWSEIMSHLFNKIN